MPPNAELHPDPDDQDLRTWTDAQLLVSISRQDERALLEVHRRYWSVAFAAARHHQETKQADAIDDAFFDIWIHAGAAAGSLLPAKLWIVGMLNRSLAQSRSP